MWSEPWVGKISEGVHGNLLQYSCLENPMGTGACWAIVHRVTKSLTRLKRLTIHQTGQVIKYGCFLNIFIYLAALCLS